MSMTRRGRAISLLVLLLFCYLLACSRAASAQTTRPQTWELHNGQWQQVTAPPPAATKQTIISDPQLDRIEPAALRGNPKSAMKRLATWFKANRGSPARDRALMMMAQALYRYGDRVKAFYYLDELMDEYPDSPLFGPALQLQYDIADAYLHGYKRRIFMLPVLEAYDEAIEMLYRIQQRAPGSVLAEKSLLRTADYFYADQQYDLSAAVYHFYIEHYPRSPVIPRVRLREAYSNLAQFRGPRFDPTPVIDARTQLLDLKAQYPEVAQAERIDPLLRRIDGVFARKIYLTADFYRRTRQPKAAAYLYDYLVQAYPGAPETAEARRRLSTLPRPPLQPHVQPAQTNAVTDAR
jgi:outer membrane assembly lipoprotein YfiO